MAHEVNTPRPPVVADKRIAINHILVTTDFSPASEAAVRYAAAIARSYGSTLHLAHFIRPQIYQMVPPDAIAAVMRNEWELASEKMTALDRSEAIGGLPHHVYLKETDLAIGLESLVRSRNIDLVVIGSNGRKGVDRLMLGSTAEEIFRRVEVPVLTLGPRAWERQPEFHRILYATDLSPAAKAAAPYALSLAQEHQSELMLLHALESDGEAQSAAREAGVEAALRAMVPPEANVWCAPQLVIKTGQPADVILETAGAFGADLIVVGARQPRAWSLYTGWATAYRLICHAACPVLTVREPRAASGRE